MGFIREKSYLENEEEIRMQQKPVTNLAKILITIWNTMLFALVWVMIYNDRTFDSYKLQGALLSILIWYIIYTFFSRLYKAFRIASCAIGETVFSQMLSFGFADAILYVECCLIDNEYVNIFPGLGAACLQIVGTAICVLIVKRYFMTHMKPKRTLLAYGEHIELAEVKAFCKRLLKKYEHLFEISGYICETESMETLDRALEDAEDIICYEMSMDQRYTLMEIAVSRMKTIYFTPRLGDIMLQGCSNKHLLDTPLMKYEYNYMKKSEYFSKRILDLLLAMVLVVLTSPIMLITAIAIKLEDGGPVFFKQKRCTKDAVEFDILKFRSMIVDAEKQGVTPCKEGDPRITKVGKFIRATRIDELPQILNILKGDMSFVGPRPERIEHVQQYIKELPEFAYRMRVKGGLTGYAQIYGKYNTSAYDKLRLDLMYIENMSLTQDLKILVLTIRTVFTPESTEGFEEEKSDAMKELTSKKVS